MHWWSKLWQVFASAPSVTPAHLPRPHAPAADPPVAPQAALPAVPSSVAESGTAPVRRFFLPWLPAPVVPTQTALTGPEQAVLELLHDLLRKDAVPDVLLPRAAELVPQLIALTRDNNLPFRAMAQRVSKDAVLTAEVLRQASSSYYNVQRRISDIVQAIELIGTAGLQSAIARVVLRPIYRERAGLVDAQVVLRLAEHAQALADHTAHLAEQAGLLRFDGYLAGLLHDTGWRVALCAVERAGQTLGPTPSEPFAVALTEAAHRLFGLAAQQWPITPGFSAFALDAFRHGLAAGQHGLAPLVQQSLQWCVADATADAAAQLRP